MEKLKGQNERELKALDHKNEEDMKMLNACNNVDDIIKLKMHGLIRTPQIPGQIYPPQYCQPYQPYPPVYNYQTQYPYNPQFCTPGMPMNNNPYNQPYAYNMPPPPPQPYFTPGMNQNIQPPFNPPNQPYFNQGPYPMNPQNQQYPSNYPMNNSQAQPINNPYYENKSINNSQSSLNISQISSSQESYNKPVNQKEGGNNLGNTCTIPISSA